MQVESTRPKSRAERRAEAARIQAEKDAAATQTETSAGNSTPAAQAPAPAPATATAPAAEPVGLPMKPRKQKGPFATQIRTETIARLAWATRHGALLTEMTDAALTDYLDRANVPVPDETGKMPD